MMIDLEAFSCSFFNQFFDDIFYYLLGASKVVQGAMNDSLGYFACSDEFVGLLGGWDG